jgi:hypothetical protein
MMPLLGDVAGFLKDNIPATLSGNSTTLKIGPSISTGNGTSGAYWTITTTAAPVTVLITVAAPGIAPGLDSAVVIPCAALPAAVPLGAVFNIDGVIYRATAAAAAAAVSITAVAVNTQSRGVAAGKTGTLTSASVTALTNAVFRESTKMIANNGTQVYPIADAIIGATTIYLYPLGALVLPLGSIFSVNYYNLVNLAEAINLDLGSGVSEQTDINNKIAQIVTKTGKSFSEFTLTTLATDIDPFIRDALKADAQLGSNDQFTTCKRAFIMQRGDGGVFEGFLNILSAKPNDGARATGRIDVSMIVTSSNQIFSNQ